MKQELKEELNSIICQSSSDYDVLNEVYRYIDSLEKENKKFKKKLQKISNEFCKYDWITANQNQVVNQLNNLYKEIFGVDML